MLKYDNRRSDSDSNHNLNKSHYYGVGALDVPPLTPFTGDVDPGVEFIGFNYARSCREREDRGLHFFVDDYQFNRIWREPDKYLPMMRQFRYVLTPDFSLYCDWPKAVQQYNHYRKHWCGAWWQDNGVNVIPTLRWSDRESLSWCLDGEPSGGTVAVSSVGMMGAPDVYHMFCHGFEVALERLQPSQVLFWGTVPDRYRDVGLIRRMDDPYRRRLRDLKERGRCKLRDEYRDQGAAAPGGE